jgi:hypothetical protein
MLGKNKAYVFVGSLGLIDASPKQSITKRLKTVRYGRELG